MSKNFDFAMRLAKGSFFDRKKVSDAVDRANDRYLSKAGAFTMTRARQSIKKAPKGRINKAGKRVFRKGSSPTSEPGKPPKSHTGTLKRGIFFGRRAKHSMLVGPIRIGKGVAPRALEKGGASVRTRTIRVHGAKMKVTKPITVRARPFMGPALTQVSAKFPDLWTNSVH